MIKAMAALTFLDASINAHQVIEVSKAIPFATFDLFFACEKCGKSSENHIVYMCDGFIACEKHRMQNSLRTLVEMYTSFNGLNLFPGKINNKPGIN